MENSNYLIFGGVIAAVIVVFIIVLLIVKTPNTKHNTKHNTTPKTKQKDNFLPSPNCLKNPMTFTDITNAKKCVNTGGVGKPPFILFIRHCDRGYSKTPTKPNPPIGGNPPGVKRTTCDIQKTWQDCPGCEYMESYGGCASNNCSEEGIKRAWALGKWVDCFAKSKNLHIACVLGQTKTDNANARPMTTASIILDSLMKIGRNPCYLTGTKDDSKTNYINIKKQLYTSGFNNQIAVVVWDHGQLGSLITAITGVPASNPNIHWDDCCFDQVVVIDTSVAPSNKSGATAYNAKSLTDNDICGSKCSGKTPYPLCSYDLFANKTPATIC
jgi:hypothetical protein